MHCIFLLNFCIIFVLLLFGLVHLIYSAVGFALCYNYVILNYCIRFAVLPCVRLCLNSCLSMCHWQKMGVCSFHSDCRPSKLHILIIIIISYGPLASFKICKVIISSIWFVFFHFQFSECFFIQNDHSMLLVC